MTLHARKPILILLVLFMLAMPIGSAYAFAQEQPAPSIPDYGITFTLEKVTELKRGYLFEGTVTWTDANIEGGIYPWGAHLTDAKGRVLRSEEAQPRTSGSTDEMQSRWAFQSLKKSRAFPLTLTIDGYSFRLGTEGTFSVDLGANPQLGQTWSLDLDLQVAGYPLHIDSVTLIDEPYSPFPYLEFSVLPEQYVYAASFIDLQNPPLFGGGGVYMWEEWGSEPFETLVSYRDGLPSGVREFSIEDIDITIKDPWQTTWRP